MDDDIEQLDAETEIPDEVWTPSPKNDAVPTEDHAPTVIPEED